MTLRKVVRTQFRLSILLSLINTSLSAALFERGRLAISMCLVRCLHKPQLSPPPQSSPIDSIVVVSSCSCLDTLTVFLLTIIHCSTLQHQLLSYNFLQSIASHCTIHTNHYFSTIHTLQSTTFNTFYQPLLQQLSYKPLLCTSISPIFTLQPAPTTALRPFTPYYHQHHTDKMPATSLFQLAKKGCAKNIRGQYTTPFLDPTNAHPL